MDTPQLAVTHDSPRTAAHKRMTARSRSAWLLCPAWRLQEPGVVTRRYNFAARSVHSWLALDSGQGLLKIVDQVRGRLDADRKAHIVRRDAGHACSSSLSCEWVVAGRVDDQRLGVADVRQVREELDRFDELLARLEPALDAEAEDRADLPLGSGISSPRRRYGCVGRPG